MPRFSRLQVKVPHRIRFPNPSHPSQNIHLLLLRFVIRTLLQERSPQRPSSGQSLFGIHFEEEGQEPDHLLGVGVQAIAVLRPHAGHRPLDEFLQGVAPVANRRHRALEHGPVQVGAAFHSPQPEHGRYLDDGFHVVGRVEEGEALGEDGQ